MISVLVTLLAAAPLCSSAGPACRANANRNHVQMNGAAGAPDTLGRGHWLVDEENDEVLLVKPGDEVVPFGVGRWPEALLVARDGRVFVTCREAGQLAVILRDGRVRLIDVGAEPRALALDESAGVLYVALVTGREVVAFDVVTFEPIARHALPFEPTAMALTGDTLALGSRKSATVVLLDAATLDERWPIEVPPRGPTTARIEGLYALEGELVAAARFTDSGLSAPAVADTGGYGGSQVFVAFDVALLRLPQTVDYAPFEMVTSTGLTEVSAAAVAGDRLYLSSRGARMTVAFRADGFPAPVSFGARAWDPGVLALSVDEAGSLAALDTHRRQLVVDQRIVAMPPSRLDAEVRLGRELFHAVGDRRLSARPMGCASCHPDGREDGLVWKLNGTQRQTPMLAAGRLSETAPYNWLGGADTLESNLTQTIGSRLMGEGLQPRELNALSRYLREGLREVRRGPAPEPRQVARGREVFADASVGCASCHPADFAFTDGARHDVQSMNRGERPDLPRTVLRLGRKTLSHLPNVDLPGGAYDTPSLVGLALTAPYFHDGSAATLDEVIGNNGDRMGTTSKLTEEDRDALVAYLSTL